MAGGQRAGAEVKAGLFLTFSIGLLVALLIIYGKTQRSWIERRELDVLFCNIGNLRSDATVQYNGLEVGKLHRVRIVDLAPEVMARLPRLDEHHLENLPLTEDEKEFLRGVGEGDLDREIRTRIAGRTMVELKLDVLSDVDQYHYRSDDRVRVRSSLMGAALVSIISGTGTALDPAEPRYLIGVSGDMYSHLSKSLEQVKNILGSLSEMVGGGDADSPMAERLENFDAFSERIEKLAGALEQKIPAVWDGIDGNLDVVGERMHAAETSIQNIQPELLKAFDAAQKTLDELRANFKEMSDEGHKQVQALRARVLKEIGAFREMAKEGRERIPILVNKAYEWSCEWGAQVDAIDRWMTQSDRTLNQGVNSARQTIQGLRVMFDDLEERLWYLAHRPEMAFGSRGGAAGLEGHAAYRKALLQRHYLELRQELERLRKGFKADDASDQARLNRVQQLLAELDAYVNEPQPQEVKRGRRR